MKPAICQGTGLGIEVENARIKIVALAPGGPRARAYAVPLRGGPPRGSDITAALERSLDAFRCETGTDPSCLPAVVATSHQFAFASFRQALGETVAVLRRCLPEARLAADDGTYGLAEAALLAETPAGALRFAAARVLGIRQIALHGAGSGSSRPARRPEEPSLAIDVGSTSTELVPLPDGAAGGPVNEARLTDGRLIWIGMQDTPLDYVAREVAGYTVVPRVGRMAAVTGLLGLGPGPLVLGPADRAGLAAEIAQAVGLDPEILGDEVLRIASAFQRAAVIRIARAIRRVASRELGGAFRRAALLGLGKEALARPALAACGVTSATDVEEACGVPPNFGAACGLAMLAARAALQVLPGPSTGNT